MARTPTVPFAKPQTQSHWCIPPAQCLISSVRHTPVQALQYALLGK